VSRGFSHPADFSSFFLSVLVIDKYLGAFKISLRIPWAMQCGPDPKGLSAAQTFVPLSDL
jgi:hypothetical protein